MSRTARIVFFALIAMLLLALPSSAIAKKHSKSKSKLSRKADRNRDGLPDKWEKKYSLSLKVNQSGRDQDRDGMRNKAEWLADTNPRDKDSDDDGINDASEQAGTVKSFTLDTGSTTTGTLVITTFGTNGTDVTGKVDASTEIECENDGDDEGEHGHHGGDHGDRGRDHAEDDAHSSHNGGGDDNDDDNGPALPMVPGTPPATPAPTCTVANLVPGAKVHEAELEIVANVGPVWHEIELIPQAPAATPPAP